MISSREILALLLYIALLLVSGIYLLDSKVLWLDELATGIHLLKPLSEFWSESVNQAHAPLVYYPIKVWSLVFGVSPKPLSMYSLTVALIVIAVTFYLYRKTGIALIMVFITIIHPQFIHFAIEVKQYILIYLLALVMTHFQLRYFQDKQFRDLIILNLIAICGFYSHPWFFIYFGSVGLANTFFHLYDRSFWSWKELSVFLTSLLFSIPALLIYIKMNARGALHWMGNFSIEHRIMKSAEFLFGNWYNWIVIFLIVAAAIFFRVRLSRLMKLLVLNIVITIFAALIINSFTTIFFHRYLFIIFPAINLLLFYLVESWIRSKEIKLKVGLLLFFVSIPMVAFNTIQEEKNEKRWSTPYMKEFKYVLELSNSTGHKALIVTMGKYGFYHYYNEVINQGKMDIYALPREDAIHPGHIVYSRMDIDHELLMLRKHVVDQKPEKLILIVGNYYNLEELHRLLNKYLPQYKLTSQEAFENQILILDRLELKSSIDKIIVF